MKKIFGDDEEEFIRNKICSMNLTDMRLYVNNKVKNSPTSEFGLMLILNKLINQDKRSNYYIEINDTDSKKKKSFDLILLILKNKYLSLKVLDLISVFVRTYDKIIIKYDRDNKEIYDYKIQENILIALDTIKHKLTIENFLKHNY